MTDTMSQAAGEFKFIVVEQDHFTKCVHFLSVKRHKPKRPFCFVLLDMFTVFELRLFREVVTAVNLLR